MPRRPDMPPLHRSALAAGPIEQFRDWYELAEREVPLADAMTLATVDDGGMPDARMVLLKGAGADGFRFFTNLRSAKGVQLSTAPRAALVVYWRELDRQVRVRGRVEALSEVDSDDYFRGRSRDSQIGAWASRQSRVLSDRSELDRQVSDTESRFLNSEVPRPEFWGGFVVRPDSVEFWQGQAARLHDRFRYMRDGAGWTLERLAP